MHLWLTFLVSFTAIASDLQTNIDLAVKDQNVITLSGYGSFRGTTLSASKGVALNRPIDAWLGIEYSVQPTGQDRFRPPTWPRPFKGVRQAKTSGPACYQDTKYGSTLQSEACLLLNIYRPSGVSHDEKLPIFVYIHGGSFVWGSTHSFEGSSFVAKSQQPLITITMQYRLGVLGSLPSKLMESRGLLNLGLRDQHQMLKFVQKYAAEFGGDQNRITLGGLSAGAHSVGFHLFHNYGEDSTPLFHRAIMASGSPSARSFPGVDYELYQQQYRQLMKHLQCPTAPHTTALACLRATDIDTLQFVSSAMYSASEYNITWPWQPVSPGPMLEQRRSNMSLPRIPIIVTTVRDEGSRYAPQNLVTQSDFTRFWRNLAPSLTEHELYTLRQFYTAPNAGMSASRSSAYISPQFQAMSASYGDYAYICPARDVARLVASTHTAVYKALFDTPNRTPAYLGVPHASDEQYFIGNTNTEYPSLSDTYSSYFASFVVSGNPNTYALIGSPEWAIYNGTARSQLVVSTPDQGGLRMSREDDSLRSEQCAWWMNDERSTSLHRFRPYQYT